MWEWHLVHDIKFSRLMDFASLSTTNALDEMEVFTIYGWDSAMAVGRALHEYDIKYNISNIHYPLNNSTTVYLTDRLRGILKNEGNESFWFLGATGNVSFKQTGDRRLGFVLQFTFCALVQYLTFRIWSFLHFRNIYRLHSLGNVVDDDGKIEDFAVWIDDEKNGSFVNDVDLTALNITWPDAFVELGVRPMSSKMVQNVTVSSLNYRVQYSIISLSIVSMAVVLCVIFLQFLWRRNEIIRASSWKLNLITCTGCLLCHCTIILYGSKHNVALCNLRFWFLCISFTMVFMPLFMKTYRISIFVTGVLGVKNIQDYHLVIGVIICLLIDTLILAIFTILDPDRAILTNGDRYPHHALLDIQEQYAVCAKGLDHEWDAVDVMNSTSYVFLLVIVLWKGMQLVFGGTVAMIVSRSRLDYIHKYDESRAHAISILFAIVVTLMSCIPIILKEVNNPTAYYLDLGICGILITNVVLAANFIPRLWAVYRGKEEVFKQSCPDAMAFETVWKQTLKKKGKSYMVRLWSQVESTEMVRLQPSSDSSALSRSESSRLFPE